MNVYLMISRINIWYEVSQVATATSRGPTHILPRCHMQVLLRIEPHCLLHVKLSMLQTPCTLCTAHMPCFWPSVQTHQPLTAATKIWNFSAPVIKLAGKAQ
jgi:hypothetical protein